MTRRAAKRGTLRYDRQWDRFSVQCGDDSVSLHCGEEIGLRIGRQFVWGRLEVDMAGSWCIIFPGSTDGKSTVLTLRTAGTYDAKIYL
ncbi:DUF5348 domain-containing protein [Alicyclobacillus macrosporangiidus]|uniref:DUF5348 domain-containing protein n=1 Tax=Alicyclobacillus macrosporangiidus TaxID=392015 RepID=A0A1I7LIV1_9BACL|nr:hypothetical protein SAMN05421543_1632 [Alicyclobacillus macrosporangiidus]